jgi:hypothetical protein
MASDLEDAFFNNLDSFPNHDAGQLLDVYRLFDNYKSKEDKAREDCIALVELYIEQNPGVIRLKESLTDLKADDANFKGVMEGLSDVLEMVTEQNVHETSELIEADPVAGEADHVEDNVAPDAAVHEDEAPHEE